MIACIARLNIFYTFKHGALFINLRVCVCVQVAGRQGPAGAAAAQASLCA